MKQIDECLTRFFDNKPPLQKKWKAISIRGYEEILFLYHYQHLVLAYNFKKHICLHEWWEKPADKRGLDSAKAWLEERWHQQGNLP